VREHGRLKAVERDGEDGGARAEQLAREGEDEDAEPQGERDHGHARPERDGPEGSAVVLPEALLIDPLLARRVRRESRLLGPHLARLDEEQRQRRQKLRERRVLVDQLVVARDEVVVCRRNHHDLIHGDALARDDRQQVQRHQREQERAQQLGPPFEGDAPDRSQGHAARRGSRRLVGDGDGLRPERLTFLFQ
jgi:hypothetical protein